MKDYYQILGIPSNASHEEIKSAYRKLALKYHPDVNKSPDAFRLFIEVNEAYEVLRDEAKRKQYDQGVNSQEWKKQADEKSQQYSSMRYDDFADRIIEELRLGVQYTPNLLFILICLTGVICAFFIMSRGMTEIGLIMIGFYAPSCYLLYRRAKLDYIAERRIKILNKFR